MKNLRMFAAFALVAMSLFAVSAEAQEISVLFGDEMASSKQVKLFETFPVYIVVSNINDTIGAVEYTLNLPANVLPAYYSPPTDISCVVVRMYSDPLATSGVA